LQFVVWPNASFCRSLLFLRLQPLWSCTHAGWWLFTRHSPSFASCPLAAGTKVTHESCHPAYTCTRRRAITLNSCFCHPKRHCSSIQTANHGSCKSLYVRQEWFWSVQSVRNRPPPVLLAHVSFCVLPVVCRDCRVSCSHYHSFS
jgi:hypothetical protein